MKNIVFWSIDKILGVGLLLALYLSMLLGYDANFTTMVVSGLLGYLGRMGQEKLEKVKP